MKKLSQYILFASATGLLFTGCLKDDASFIDYTTAPPALQFLYAEHDGDKVIEAFDLSNDAQDMPIEVAIASKDPLGTAVNAKVSPITNAAQIYNQKFDDEYNQLPADAYTMTVNTVSVPAGTRSVPFVVKVNSSKIPDLSKKWMVGFQLTDPSGAVIASNLGKVFIEVVVRNAYHAYYRATGVFHHPVNGDRPIDMRKELITTGPNSVIAYLGDLGPDYQMVLTVNADNSVTITPAGDTPNIDQHWGVNRYDPATHTFHLHYSYNTAAPRIVEETFVRE
ncbi:BT_3044 domain-containing protein [Chitinophaga deserti]|uniref:BT_3044 domain-containing protein n=1 Tax=Chitinophaga deserti TaxID=2164099 RepID=UPI0018E50D8F|nr:DUF4361 domain-containing protein [Chitinophaga deserti]